MKKLIPYVFVYCLSVFLLTYFHKKNTTSIRQVLPLEREEHFEGPKEFQRFHQEIRTKDGETAPGYEDNYQWKELKLAIQRANTSQSYASRTESANGVLEFKERGPANVPGRTRGVLIDPDDASHKTWYAGAAAGGIWKTIDAGQSWQWLTPDLPNLATTTLAMAGTNHNILYAGTGEGYGQIDGVNGHGIFKSTNRGISWSLLSNTSGFSYVNRIIISPLDENVVIVASNNGIYRTLDGGLSWTKVYNGLVQDIEATPGNFSIQYATRNSVGIIKSSDGGATWNLSNAGMSPNGRLEIAVSPINVNWIFASSEGALSGTNSDLYFSSDAGVTWKIVDMKLATKTLNYLGDQGWYDNAIVCDPYYSDVVYIAGIGAYKVQIDNSSSGTVAGSYSMEETGTTFITLVNFQASAYGGKLSVGTSANKSNVEIRFGPGKTQKAHRFLVPDGATSGVTDANYTYQDYVDVPFEVWDVTNNRQLMASFRDQDRNGAFNLLLQNTTDAATLQSREYLFVNNIDYAASASPAIGVNGGHAVSQMYFVWPVLSAGSTWNPASLPASALKIKYSEITKVNSTVTTLSDSYNDYNGVNNANFVHPDQHNIVIIKENETQKTFRILLANDGGLFLSGISTSPGTTQGEWVSSGKGYNTSQFYGADKRPGFEEFLGGMQDNSTYFSPKGAVANSTSQYSSHFSLSGDGFEAIWHNLDDKKMIGGSQYCNFSRSIDGGTTWSKSISGLTLSGTSPDNTKYPFISKLANSKQAPDIIFTVGSEGVWRSTDFGGSWVLTPVTQKWGLSSLLDVEVSRANANIVWAGSGMTGTRNLHVSQDGGKTFTVTQNYSTLGGITKLASHPTESQTAYAIFSIAASPKIIRTKNLGQTWEDISGFSGGAPSTRGFPDVAVYCLYVRNDDTNIIWAGTEIGIVESLDGGLTWNILSDFPKVPVWDMKGQDDMIVIATHGRGIWTAKLSAIQVSVKAPEVLAAGTNPQSKLAIKLELKEDFDSTQVWVNSSKVGKIGKVAKGVYIAKVSNVPAGKSEVKLIGFVGKAPVHSSSLTTDNFLVNSPQSKYFNLFSTASDFITNGLSVQPFGSADQAMQSLHNYVTNSESTAILKQPVIVSSSGLFFYRDVAIVEPANSGATFGQAAFNDYVVAEATKDGLTWLPLDNGYNASSNSTWLNAYNTITQGNESMFVSHNTDLKTKFSVNDTLLFRFRLSSNASTVSWGWAIDDLYIQQEPTGDLLQNTDHALSLYPNPSNGIVQVDYSLVQKSEVSIVVYGLDGSRQINSSLGLKEAGTHHEELDLSSLKSGAYLLRLQSGDKIYTKKVLLKK